MASEVLSARRYRFVAPDLVRRIAAEELRRADGADDAVKRTKRKLHQVCGAYAAEFDAARAIARLKAGAANGAEGLRAACADVMKVHASTRERLSYVRRFYRGIFDITGSPSTVVDVACGLGPLAVPWMDLAPEATYTAYDADARLVETVDTFLALAGVPHIVELRDVTAHPPEHQADVALVLKTLPCLEQQRPGAARRLLEELRAKWVVVSYPTRSLGGAGGKGMDRHYRRQFEALDQGLFEGVRELAFPGELVFACRRTEG